MNSMLDQFYYDAIHRYLENSAFYGDIRRDWENARGKSWNDLTDAAICLAEGTGYLTFLLGLRLGILLGGELEELAPSVF